MQEQNCNYSIEEHKKKFKIGTMQCIICFRQVTYLPFPLPCSLASFCSAVSISSWLVFPLALACKLQRLLWLRLNVSATLLSLWLTGLSTLGFISILRCYCYLRILHLCLSPPVNFTDSSDVVSWVVHDTIPYSGLFSWGTNFRYFHGQPTSHEIFHPRILRSVACAVQSRAD